MQVISPVIMEMVPGLQAQSHWASEEISRDFAHGFVDSDVMYEHVYGSENSQRYADLVGKQEKIEQVQSCRVQLLDLVRYEF